MLGFMAITGVFGLHNLQGLNVSLLPPDEIYCCLPTQLTVRISSRRRFLPYCLLRIQVDEAVIQVPILNCHETLDRKMMITFQRRGPGSMNLAIVTSPFPVNFFVRSNSVPIKADYLVFPRPMPVFSNSLAGTVTRRGTAHSQKKGGGEMEAIAPYTGQEPLKLVHWRLTARHGELLVKEMGSEAGTPVIINLDELPGRLEERLSHAVFLVNRLMAAGKAVGLKLGDKQHPPGISRRHRLKLLGELAHHAAD